ncbi:phage tail assembly protein [Helicobacter mastomyrinus]|uniref:Phage tail assembly protein n=1 Tax=Helicobacter mastomyrinus TaxID=287948 RepID=A0ABZ3F366_9HELI
MLKSFDKEIRTFTFRDGQEVLLKEPTLLQIQSARSKAKDDEIALAKALLIDMSDGEINNEFLDSLPVKEFNRLSNEVSGFIGIDERD